MKSEQTKWRGIRRGLITQIVAVESEYILSQPQGPDLGPHKNLLCAVANVLPSLTTIHSRLPLSFQFSEVPGPVHDYCSSWQLINLSAVWKRK